MTESKKLQLAMITGAAIVVVGVVMIYFSSGAWCRIVVGVLVLVVGARTAITATRDLDDRETAEKVERRKRDVEAALRSKASEARQQSAEEQRARELGWWPIEGVMSSPPNIVVVPGPITPDPRPLREQAQALVDAVAEAAGPDVHVGAMILPDGTQITPTGRTSNEQRKAALTSALGGAAAHALLEKK